MRDLGRLHNRQKGAPVVSPEAPRPRRPRRSRQQVSEQLVEAAAQLFAERDSGHVTVRDIAARADVNAGLIQRYFGGKQNLMRAAMERVQGRLAERVGDLADVQRDIGQLFLATLEEREFVAVLARASLDGVLPAFPAGYPTMEGLARRLEEQREEPGSIGGRDVRPVAAALAALTLGYALFGDFIRRGTGLEYEPEARVREELIKILQAVVALALATSPAPQGHEAREGPSV